MQLSKNSNLSTARMGASQERSSLIRRLPAIRALRGAVALALVAATVSGGAADAAPATKPGHGSVDAVVRSAAAQQPGGTIQVIIQHRATGTSQSAVQRAGGQVKGGLKLGNALVAQVPASAVDQIAADPSVARISFDAPVRSTANPQSEKSTGLDAWRLQTAYPEILQAAPMWGSNPPLLGIGVGVAVLDSGIKDHPDFGTSCDSRISTSRIVRQTAIATDANGGPGDDNGHGTFVAGVIAGRGCGDWSTRDDSNYIGVAPGANIISVKVSDRYGVSHASDLIRGIEWVVANKDTYNIRVMNLSLASTVAESYRTSLIDAAVELAALKGIVVVAAAGNGGPNAVGYAPANDPFVIAVGATDDHGTQSTADDSLASFSSYGTTVDGLNRPDLVAPGRHIVAPLASIRAPLAVQYPDHVLDNGFYIRLSGTSMAAPMVSGIAAQLLQAYPNLNADGVKWLLMHTARPLGFAGTGAGYPSTMAANGYSHKAFFEGGSPIGHAFAGLTLNNYVAMAAYALQNGVSLSSVAWDSVAWDSVAWDSVAWDSVAWDSVAWDSVAWDSVAWDSVAGN